MTKITVDALIYADIDCVWKFYTQPEHITKWNFASEDWHCPKVQNDLKPGGIYIARMEAKDGSFGFDFKAVYDEILPLKKIIYTMEDNRKVITTFENLENQTKITTLFDAENQNTIDIQKKGWQAIIDNFKRYVEDHKKDTV
ncbi:SRPBCC family protein [Flavobacterium dauae]|uniref:SRPBCC family protein n=1 Tax=Flavobacterium dauae TaxID=1563479 RepID=UPI001A92D963|nr:SRPBCC family protein [Flavobacterium dauae]WLD23359.1 SRPBCC family protein [Flavobacterium dauae]